MIQLGMYANAIISAYAFTSIILFILVLQTLVAFRKHKKLLESLIDNPSLSNE
tara:strand:- start:429 stop:587 length:159 start_codon:yes stop_codon:yes gene_type:complete